MPTKAASREDNSLKRQPIDAVIEVVTPENTAIQYRAAGPFRRGAAFGIDVLIVVLAWCFFLAITLTLTAAFSNAVLGLQFVFQFLLTWFFTGFLEALLNGKTVGKIAMGLRVVTVDGGPIDLGQSITRTILRTVDIVFPLVTLAITASNRRFQRLGDMAAGTMVVLDETSWLGGVVRIDDARVAQLASFIPVDFEVKNSLARALSTYVERRRFMSTPRRREVAKCLGEPLIAKFGLPADTSHDLLLCSLYYRTFVTDRRVETSFSPRPIVPPVAQVTSYPPPVMSAQGY